MEEIVMKKRTVKALICATLMAISLSATACGGSDDGAKGADAATEEAAPAEEEASAEEEAPAEEETPAEGEAPAEEEAPAEVESGSQKTLEDFIKDDPTAEQQLQEQAAAQGDDEVDMSIEIKGNDVVCVATFKEGIELPDGTADVLNEGME